MINVKFKNIPKLYTTPKPISKLLKIFLEITLLVFSLDFGLYKYKSRLTKIVIVSILAFSTLLSISTFVSYLPNISHFTMLWHIKTLVLNHINILVLFIIPENKSFYIFLNHLHSIDVKLGVDSNSYRLDIKILIYFAVTVSFKIITSCIYCFHYRECLEVFWFKILSFFPLTSMDIPLLIFFFVFYASRCRLVTLRKFIENTPCDPLYFQCIYKSLVDATETAKDALIPIVS